jgi:hypothetical protein
MIFYKNKLHWRLFLKRLSKTLHQQLRKLIRVLNHSIVPIITVLFSICIFAILIPQAQSIGSPPDRANVVSVSGEVSPGYGSSLTSGNSLWVAGTYHRYTESWAHLQFLNGKTRVDPIVQAGVNEENTYYNFPCGPFYLGEGVVGWGLEVRNSRSCTFIDLTTGEWRSSTDTYLPEKTNTKASRKESEIAQQIPIPATRVRVGRVGKNLTLIKASHLNGKLAIDVLLGTVTVELSGDLRENVSAGNRYIVTGSGQGGTIERINVPKEVQSRSIQIFLDPSTWSKDVTPLIQQFQQALLRIPNPG